ncbi:MAG: stage IV sporulation protein A [Christensenellaceae bacterium]|nr:stage IV sporulation protein A [Christensenellaceae bacterium]
MANTSIYRDIQERTGGDIYIGVVGPVRTGKSTFIKRFMDLMVLPKIENEFARERIVDELPQSGSGKTVMTTQPKFVPNEAVELNIGDDNIELRVRMVDCVGYMVNGALGNTEGELPRMVRTPWYDYDIPFDEAAEIGTQKVITEHSTIGVVIMTDGSITGIARSDYAEAEERVISELNNTGKPYIIILNTINPTDPDSIALANELSEKYHTPVTALDVMDMSIEDIHSMLERILLEFPLQTVSIELPNWIKALGVEHPLVKGLLERAARIMPALSKMRDYALLGEAYAQCEDFQPIEQLRISLGTGSAVYRLLPNDDVFYRILSEECEYNIANEAELIASLKDFVKAKRAYDRIAHALTAAEETGYGLVPPAIDEMQLDSPEIVQHGGRFGVRLKARASGLHIIRVDIESEVNPLVGTAEQSEQLINYLMDKFEHSPDEIWQTDIFGKSLYDLVKEGMAGKVARLPVDVQLKLRDAVTRMVNEGCNGLICIML